MATPGEAFGLGADQLVGASREVIEHHVTVHERVCAPDGGRHEIEVLCDHGEAMLLCCPDCGERLFGMVRPGATCEHAALIASWAFGGAP